MTAPWQAITRGGVLCVILASEGCIASNVLDAADREVISDEAESSWQSVTADAIPGLFESVEIRGQAAAGLWKIYYLFEAEGRYTASALVTSDDGLRFQVIDGTWSLDEQGMVLDGAEPAKIDGADDRLRITTPEGSVVLKKSEVR